MSDTIFALSSGALPAGIAVLRVSGPHARAAAEQLCGSLGAPRTLALRDFRDSSGELIDRGLVVFFPAPATVTGEDLIEFHCHGGRAVVTRMRQVLGGLPGLRLSEPGEFTRRALFNGRLDLTEAEGLADLLAAETEWQRRAAVATAGGHLSRRIEGWRKQLVLLAAEAEAAIDYVDEEETEPDLSALQARLEELAAEWRHLLDQPRAELLGQGLKVVLAGPPNAGKSSLFNALVGSERAIVTPIAGTTRDLIEAAIDLEGIKLVLVDTAGLRESGDAVEQIGVGLAKRAQEEADILLWLGPAGEQPSHSANILVHARCDERSDAVPHGAIATSVTTGSGLSRLREEMLSKASGLLPAPDLAALNERQARALERAHDSLSRALAPDILLVAESLRQALRSLDELSARQGTEDVLDQLFARFCLGK